jgi:hypothetical protein
MATTRRRRPNETESSLSPSDLLDSDDQECLLQDMTTEMERQQALICSAFRVVCLVSAVTSLLCSLLVEWKQGSKKSSISSPSTSRSILQLEGRFLLWFHACLSAALHLSATYTASSLPPSNRMKWIVYIPFACSLLAAFSALAVARNQVSVNESLVWFHHGVLLANAATSGAGLFLRWDAQSIHKSMQDLQASQYRYKSL